MHITLERSSLLKSLNHLHRIVEKRNTIAILSNILFIADSDASTLEMKTTDLDLEMTETIEAKIVHSAGKITAPAHLLYDIVRKFPDGCEIMIASSNNEQSISISSGSASFHIQCLPETDFPQMEGSSFDNIFEISSNNLKNLIDKIQFAISTEETRHYLNGIYLHIYKQANQPPQLRTVATDGHRLAKTEIEASAESLDIPAVIIPKKTVHELQRLIDNRTTNISVEVSETKIRFKTDNTVLTSKLIHGSFPDYQRVIPKGNNKVLIIHRQNFLQAVDRVSTISSDKGHAIKINLSKEKVTLSVNDTHSGSATETLEASYDAEDIEVGFNARYLLDAVGQLEDEKIRFSFSTGAAPCIIEDIHDTKTLYILMPMRI